ncbi:MAG: DUF3365 domain-containing protein, partial [Gammaproteobacteria bacterium]|nr:DUF3365 domain-containing protein [Gammaproteobacteria bacterium]
SFGLVLVSAFSLVEIIGYRHTQENILAELRQDAREIQGILMATRRVYHHQFVSSGLLLNKKTLGFLPAHAMNRISADFKSWSDSGLTFNNVSDRPRNPANRADAIEQEALDYFRTNPAEKERLVPFNNAQGESFYHFSSPIWIEQYCLKCHGERLDAPDTIRELYDSSFNYKLGELRGVMSIKLPATFVQEAVVDERIREAWWHLLAFVITFTFGAWLLRRWVIRRLRELQSATAILAEGDYAIRVPVQGADELSDVAAAFNEMAAQRQHAETALRESEAWHRGMFHGSRDALMILTPPSWRFISGNPATLALFGAVDEAEFISCEPWSLSPEYQPDGQLSSDKAKEMIECAMREGSNLFEWRHKRLNGEEFPATVLLSRMELEGQQILLATVRDVSAEKQAEESSLEREQQVLDLLNSTAEAIIGVDPDGICSFANPASLQILGYQNASELIGHNLHQTIHHKRADGTLYPREECPMYQTLQSGNGFHVDNELLWRADGSSFPAEYWSHPIYRDAQVVGSVVAFLDITERMHVEEVLRRSQKMDAIGQLTGGIAHDFNNILAIILGNLDLLERQMTADDKALKRMGSMRKAGQRATDLTKQLLSFSRDQVAETSITDINQLIREMESLIARSVTPEVEVANQFADELWHTRIDSGDFEDSLINLIINARDAMAGHGHLTIETRNATLDATYCDLNPGVGPGEYVELTVSDNGEGIPRDKQERIFEPFYTTKTKGKGTGLGLAMVFGFVKRSGGHIKCYSEVGVGTTFHLYLPRAEGEAQYSVQSGKQSEPLPRGTETILVVDDEPGLVELAKESLEVLGYRVRTAGDGSQALECLAQEPKIDLLFSDVVMPGGLNGYELAKQATAIQPELKVQLTSGYTSKATAKNGYTNFNAKLLTKPYAQSELANRVREILDEQRTK